MRRRSRNASAAVSGAVLLLAGLCGAASAQTIGPTPAGGAISCGQMPGLTGAVVSAAASCVTALNGAQVISTTTGGATPPAGSTNTLLQLAAPNTTADTLTVDSWGAVDILALRRADGTIASPTAVQLNEQLGALNIYGYDGNVPGTYGLGTGIQSFAGANWTATSHPGYFQFKTTPLNSTTLATALVIDQSQQVTIGSTSGNGTGNLYTGPIIGSSTILAGSHILATSAAPSISACGTGSPSVSGSDSFGRIVAGTVATTCVINFGTSWGAAPSCSAASGTAISGLTVSASTSQLTIGGSALGGDTITWICGSTG